MDSYKFINVFNPILGKTFTAGSLDRSTQPVKHISIPISMDFKNTGYSDLINKLAKEEKESNINTVIDKETMKFTSAINGTSDKSNLKMEFHFIDSGGTYSDSFINAGFEQSDINNSTNRITKSFFRLDFYDSPNEKEQNFLFSEFLNVNLNSVPSFSLDRIYWLKRDTKFINENTYRELFIEALFYNAKDGVVRRFINRGVVSTVTLNEYKTNQEWRFAKLKVLNPYTIVNTTSSNDNKVFYVEGINGNTDDLIKFVEIKIT